jgi:hypothetical protein
MEKLYNLSVKTMDYTNSKGERKKRYLSIGAIYDSGKGPYMILDRTFNPAGVSNPDNRTGVVVSMFEPREHNSDKIDLDDEPSDYNEMPF